MGKKRSKKKPTLVGIILIIVIGLGSYYKEDIEASLNKVKKIDEVISYNITEIPEYNGEPYVVINNNEPFFEESDKITESFEVYSALDSLGRCGVAYANVSLETMPDEKRGSIGGVKPSGWHTVKYDIIEGSIYIIGVI